MFDSSKEFLVKIVSGGVKSCALKFPSDAQLCERAHRQKTIRHFLGRGKSKTTDVNTEAVDVQLFESLRVERNGSAQSYDPTEAAAFIERLDLADVVSGEWDGDARRMEIRVPGARTVHVLRIPKQSEIREHERATTDAVYGNRSAEIRVSLEPSGVLYDKLLVASEGYAGAVPINHKVAAVTNLLGALAALLDGDEDDPEA